MENSILMFKLGFC